MAKIQLKDVRPIIKAILTERDKMPVTTTERYGFGVEVPYSHGQSFRGGLRAALRIIEQAPVEYASTKWISVNDRLPEPFVSVLVYMPGESPLPTVHEGYYAEDGMWAAAHCISPTDEITHWAEMPEAPKEELK